jgi:hypothetical protein
VYIEETIGGPLYPQTNDGFDEITSPPVCAVQIELPASRFVLAVGQLHYRQTWRKYNANRHRH